MGASINKFLVINKFIVDNRRPAAKRFTKYFLDYVSLETISL